jgi:multiple sugar transport system permease protein
MAVTGETRSGRRRRRHLAAYLVLVALAVAFLFPVAFMVAGAFKPDGEVLADADSLGAFVPREPTTENFGDAFDRASFGRLFVNSTIIAVSVVGLGLVVNSLAGYGLARLPFRGSRLLVLAVIALTIIPLEAVAIPLLFMVSEVGWRNTYHVQILPFVANPLFVYLFYTFFLGVPKELEEAARIDGAGPWTTFIRVVVPQARPAYATVGVLSFLFIWGQLLWPVLVTSSTDVRPLPLGISIFVGQPPISWGDIMAFGLMMTAPVLVVFVAFQRWFVRSVARSGLKG